MIVVVMGVAGAGKSSVAHELASRTGWRMLEGDDMHPPANRARMSAGDALRDEDRWPWLDAIGAKVESARADGQNLIVTCSAMKRSYRDRLRGFDPDLRFLFLHGSDALLEQRMAVRTDHFMPPSLLPSQLATLQPPADDEPGIHSGDIAWTVPEIVAAFLGEVHMANTIVNPKGTAAPLSKFAPGIETTAGSRLLHVSGQVGNDADGNLGQGAEAQIRNAFANVQAVLEAADMGWNDVIRINSYLTDAADVPTFRTVRDEVLGGAMTASTLLIISGLVHPDMVVEIECVAGKD